MKTVQLVILAALVSPALCFAQEAKPVLPSFLEQELTTASAGTAFQLEANKTIDAVSSEANYHDKITYQVERDLHGFNGAVKSSMGIAGVAGMAGFFGAMPSVGGGGPGNPYRASAQSASSQKFGATEEGLLSSSIGTFFGGGVVGAGLGLLLHKNETKTLLNESKADEYSASVAKMLGKIFQFNAAKETALKFAIREEIFKKAKANDESPLDIYKILSEAKQAGKNIVTPAEASTLAALKKKDEKDGSAVPVEKDKVLFLLTGNAFLKEQLKLGKLSEEDAKKVGAQVAKNDALIKKLAEYRMASGEAKEAPAADTKESDAQ